MILGVAEILLGGLQAVLGLLAFGLAHLYIGDFFFILKDEMRISSLEIVCQAQVPGAQRLYFLSFYSSILGKGA